MLSKTFPEGILTLDDSHVYRLYGRVLPGSTQVLKDLGIINTDYYSVDAALRGTAVHDLTSLYCQYDGDFHWPSVDERYVGYVRGWEAFKKTTGFKTVMNEDLVLGDGYATLVDRVGILNGRCVIVEIKTGPRPAWVGLQTEMQRQAILRHREVHLYVPLARFCLELRADGKYKLTECTGATDAYDVQACVRVWKLTGR